MRLCGAYFLVRKMQEQTIKVRKQNMSQVFSDTGKVIPVTKVVSEEEINTDMLNKDVVVTGKSKGKGFTGVMKRWNFKGEMATRGQSNKPRSGGAIGAQTPGKVFKGKKMAGRSGNATVTIKGLKIVQVDPEKRELFVSGPLPGSWNSELVIKVL